MPAEPSSHEPATWPERARFATQATGTAIAPAQGILHGYRSLDLFDENGALVVRRDHPRLKGKVTRALHRNVVLSVPHFMIAALAAAQTDCIAGPPHADPGAKYFRDLVRRAMMQSP